MNTHKISNLFSEGETPDKIAEYADFGDLDNEQTELTAIEKGKHAFEHIDSFDEKGGRGKTGGIREYARKHEFNNDAIVNQWINAYRVILKTAKSFSSLSPTLLYEISKSPQPAWQSLCEFAIEEGWTVKGTKTAVKKVKEINPGNGYGYDLQKIYEKAAKNEARRAEHYQLLFDRIRHKDTDTVG